VSDHRRTVTRRALVLPTWALLAVGGVVVLAGAWLAWLLVTGPDGDDAPVASASSSPAATEPSATPTPEPTETTEPEPSETPEPEPTETSEPAVDRASIQVSVLNASRTQGLARTVGQRVTAEGWTVGAVGNWRGYSAANTVHYPQGREAEARQLADDLGIQAVAPIVNGMSGQRLTIVLVGPVA
jgi:pyruvate/2-oxoglutarate dehydrogenase complex dihydrolipoamide acyltransferase (E2) component